VLYYRIYVYSPVVEHIFPSNLITMGNEKLNQLRGSLHVRFKKIHLSTRPAPICILKTALSLSSQLRSKGCAVQGRMLRLIPGIEIGTTGDQLRSHINMFVLCRRMKRTIQTTLSRLIHVGPGINQKLHNVLRSHPCRRVQGTALWTIIIITMYHIRLCAVSD
jgi:hypothetical protein